MSEWQWQWWKEETSTLNQTKRADDFRALQGLWDLIRIGHEDYLRSPLFPVVMSVAFYFTCMVPFTIFDLWGKNWNWIHKYKIQPEKNVTWPACRNAILVILWNHCVYILPAAIGQAIWTPPTPLPPVAPTMTEFVLEQVVMLLIFDFQYFVWHYTHHRVKFLYKHVHSIHHQYYSPFCWVTQYLSPLELITVGTYTTVLPWVFNCHVFTTWSFMIVNIIISVEAHIGYDFPFALHNWDPTGIIGGAPKHDMHHMKPQTNFAPFFNHFDKAMGTFWPGLQAGGIKNKKYIEFENNKKMEKAKKKY
ncbi:cholesterol 25-hydroxylase-like protein 1, member 2 [Lingula anatina]|uniref:Cholesterol 25-hydroxylase-like protein 1, member 2 n=1 Tax=Lingula anatina TaxID=7574 RepID=A0A1S3HUZ2_LINAN|nr:cholesterol 25-hydroxylase-like protein 1, member 2 [Lingula anatina]|eukprot:XP_013389366.1 cholesterol 25-hydroxylase-like protein 1, member 2 [Lingula anatina]